jgi:hypothetical protein
MSALATPSQMMLGGVCLLLLAAIGYEIAAPLPVIEPPTAPMTDRTVTAPTLPVFRAPSSESFSDINSRPLFDRARRPITPTESTAPLSSDGSSPPAASLVGVIIDGGTRLAMVRTPASPLATSVSVGDTVEGWRVTKIDPDRIVLHAGGNDEEIRLEANRTNPADAAPTQGAPTALPSGQAPPPAQPQAPH